MRALAAAAITLLPCAALAQTPPAGPAGNLWANTLQVGIGSSTASCLGGGIGCVLGPFVNFQGSGHPGIFLPDRLLFQRSGAGAANDFVTLQVNRSPTFTGGALANINGAIIAQSVIPSGDATQEYALQGLCKTNGTASGLCVGSFAQGVRQSGATDPIWGGISDAVDQTHLNSALTTASVGLEVDVRADWADDSTNPAGFGNRGIRKAIQIAVHRNTLADTTQFEVSSGIWMSTGVPGSLGSDANTNFDNLIGVATNVQTRIGLDMRGATAPTGSTDPVAAVTMTGGQVVDFNGSASLISNPGGAYLQFRPATGRLYYVVAGVDMWSVDGSGNMRARGTVTGSTTP